MAGFFAELGKTNPNRISNQIAAVMCGELPYEALNATGRSVISLQIYKKARHVMTFKTREQRREALAEMPGTIRGHIEQEVIRLWGRNS